MANKKPIDWVDLAHGIDIICNPEESLEDRQGASRVFIKDIDKLKLTGASIERIRLDLHRFIYFGDSLDTPSLRSEFNQLCAEYATIAVELQQREYAQAGKKGGRPSTYEDEQIMKEYEDFKGKYPKYSKTELSKMIAKKTSGNEITKNIDSRAKNIRNIINKYLFKN
jgi:hypothetical protein